MIYVDELKKVKWYMIKFVTFTNFSTSLIFLSQFQILKSLVKYILIRFILDYTLVRMNTTNETKNKYHISYFQQGSQALAASQASTHSL